MPPTISGERHALGQSDRGEEQHQAEEEAGYEASHCDVDRRCLRVMMLVLLCLSRLELQEQYDEGTAILSCEGGEVVGVDWIVSGSAKPF